MNKPRALLTGITGSGASYLAEYIIREHPDWEVWGISRWGSTKSADNIKAIKDSVVLRECDLNDLSSIIRVLQECNPERIFHMAATANVHVAFKTPLSILQNNIMGTANLLEAVRLSCPETIFQMCSTSEVCGQPVENPITEEHPLNPCNPYAVSKLAGEKLAFSYWKSWGIKVVITRAFCYINPRRHDLFSTAFALQVARIEQGKQDILLHGNLESGRTIIDVRDVSDAYWVASEKCDYGTPYNLGGTVPTTVGGFLELLKSKAKVPITSKLNKDLLRPVDITNQFPDVRKFNLKTGWKQKITVDESVEWLLNNCRDMVKKECL